jgi:hypothetical protein
MTTAIVPSVTVDPEALAHADKVGMRAVLDHMLEATPRLVPRLRSIHITLKPDWQYDQMNIRWDVRMEPSTKDVVLAAVRAWRAEFVRVTDPSMPNFYLRLVDDAA